MTSLTWGSSDDAAALAAARAEASAAVADLYDRYRCARNKTTASTARAAKRYPASLKPCMTDFQLLPTS